MSKIKLALVFLIIFLFQSLALSFDGDEANKIYDISLVKAFPNLTFAKPVFLTHSNDGTNRIFVVEQTGRIKVFPNDSEVPNAEVFLDIIGRVNVSDYEMGLLGLAFHPDFADSGYFYVNYTAGSDGQRTTIISRFSVDSNTPNQGDPGSELILLEISQPFTNHNGGMIQFGPEDGYLYIGMGDGGSGGDPFNHGQNRKTLLGAILRIDVDNPTGNLNYGIPSDNPFIGNTQGFREEIWAYGLRNPWRFSFDPVTGELWAGDVGQSLWEEIDLIEKGNNYGWNIMEGLHCFEPPSNCVETGLILPIKQYGHDAGNCSITGGYIYRGKLQPELEAAYIYGDFCSGRIWMLRYENRDLLADSLIIQAPFNISSFGVDQNNQLYILDHNGGQIYRFSGSPPTDTNDDRDDFVPNKFTLEQNYPNPFNPETVISYRLAAASEIELTIYNALGQRIRTIVHKRQNPGNYQVLWDGQDQANNEVSSGVYLYRLRAGSFVQTHKMLLLR